MKSVYCIIVKIDSIIDKNSIAKLTKSIKINKNYEVEKIR